MTNALAARPRSEKVPDSDVEVLDPDGKSDEDRAAEDRFDALNPCGVCGVNQHEGPEGTAWHTNHTQALTCWKCGYRPGQAIPANIALQGPAIDNARVERLMGELKTSVAAEIIGELRSAGVIPPAAPAAEPAAVQTGAADVDAIRAQVRAEVEAELAGRG